MRRLSAGQARPARESTIALINVVFLMLIFFMIAGTLATPPDPGLTLVRTQDASAPPPERALVVHADGRMELQGRSVPDPAELPGLAQGPVRVMPDRALPARDLLRLASRLRAAGSEQVLIVTERVPQ